MPATLAAQETTLDEHPVLSRFRDYVNRISTGPTPSINAETALRALGLLREAVRVSGKRLILPYAYALEDGRMCCTWDIENYHLEVIIGDDADAEWYGSDGIFANAWVATTPYTAIPEEAVAKFALFLEAVTE